MLSQKKREIKGRRKEEKGHFETQAHRRSHGDSWGRGGGTELEREGCLLGGRKRNWYVTGVVGGKASTLKGVKEEKVAGNAARSSDMLKREEEKAGELLEEEKGCCGKNATTPTG